MLHHYFEHHEDDKGISFFVFLTEHYYEVHESTNSHHKDDHQQLPFKSHDHNFLAQSSPILPDVNSVIAPFIHFEANKVNFTKEPQIISQFMANIWQPPKA